MYKNEVYAPSLCGEVSMDSVGSPEEEGKLNTPVSEIHTINYYPSPNFLEKLTNMDADTSMVSDNDGSEANNDGATEMFQ